jgi:subtilisin family serine protease
VSFPTRPLRPSVVVALVVAALLAGMSSAGIVAARAPDRAGTVRASDASAPGGRLIVFWKGNRRPNLSLPLVASARSSSVGAHRSVVTAAPGQAAALAAKLRADPDVAAVVPDVILSATDWPGGDPNDPDYASQGDLPQIGMPTAWPTTIGAQTAVIAILDTGTTVNHEDLLSTKFVDAFDVVHRMSGAVDDNVTGPDGVGHGTHVTGTIAAQANNGVGIAGMAPGVSIMPIKVLDSSGTGGLAEILDGIDYARLHGADVINMSLGGRAERFDSTSLAEFQATINTAYAAGITIVAAAGNDGDGTVEYPCAFVHVICVGATDNSDNHAFFSNTNAYVDISAPGWNILSTVPTSVDPTGYHSLSGTSMATPHVAALAGLIRSIYPAETVDQVEATILQTAVDLGPAGRDDQFGAGRINAAAAVNLAPPDLIAPVMTGLASPSLVRSASRAFTATWTATDNVGVTSYEIRMKKGASGPWSAVSSQPGSSRTFSGLAGGSWYIAVRAVDGAGRRSSWRQVLTIVPKDDRAWAFSSGTLRKLGLAYINGTETRTSRAGARMTIRFTGSAFYLLGTSAVRRGKLRVTIDGRSWIVDEGMYKGSRARSTNYRVLLFARSLTNRTHTAVITCLATYGRPTIDVDAVAWRN